MVCGYFGYAFSPRMRGCSHLWVSHQPLGVSFPRVCGDVPSRRTVRVRGPLFSPRMRGCSAANGKTVYPNAVFPAYAGMFLRPVSSASTGPCFPRVCGDVPDYRRDRAVAITFSPRMRGCSLDSTREQLDQLVFPAYAGMFPRLSFKPIWVGSFPRIRGDVPTRGFTEAARAAFSPHTRGCSEEDLEQAQCHLVFPAYARMFPTWATTTGTWKGFPRIRGDVSMFERHGLELAVFSPHTRGCSSAAPRPRRRTTVFPAYAGIFL